MVFEAPDGPLGLILVSLVNLFKVLCKKAGPFLCFKTGLILIQNVSRKKIGKKYLKKNGQSLVPFLSIFGNHFGAHFGSRSAKEGAR